MIDQIAKILEDLPLPDPGKRLHRQRADPQRRNSTRTGTCRRRGRFRWSSVSSRRGSTRRCWSAPGSANITRSRPTTRPRARQSNRRVSVVVVSPLEGNDPSARRCSAARRAARRCRSNSAARGDDPASCAAAAVQATALTGDGLAGRTMAIDGPIRPARQGGTDQARRCGRVLLAAGSASSGLSRTRMAAATWTRRCGVTLTIGSCACWPISSAPGSSISALQLAIALGESGSAICARCGCRRG